MLRVRFQQIQNQSHEHQRRRLRREAVGIDITPIDPNAPATGPEQWFQGNREVGYQPFVGYGDRGHTAEPINPDTGAPLPPAPPAAAPPRAQQQAGFFGLQPTHLAIIGLAGILLYSLYDKKSAPQGAAA